MQVLGSNCTILVAKSADMPCVGSAFSHDKEKRAEFITIRASSTIKDQLTAMAEQQDRSLSWLVNRVLEQFVSEQRKMRQQ